LEYLQLAGASNPFIIASKFWARNKHWSDKEGTIWIGIGKVRAPGG